MNLQPLGILKTLLIVMGSAFTGYFIGRNPNIQPVPFKDAADFAEYHMCDLTSEEALEALAEGLTGKPDSSRSFGDLMARCGDDVRAYQLLAALELAFPRKSTEPGSGARMLVMSTLGGSSEDKDAGRLAFAIALVSFRNRDCESTELVLETLKALGFESERMGAALSEYNALAGGKPGACRRYDFRTET